MRCLLKRYLVFAWKDQVARDIPRGGISDFHSSTDDLQGARTLSERLERAGFETQVADTGRSEWPIELVWISAAEWAIYDDERIVAMDRRMLERMVLIKPCSPMKEGRWFWATISQGAEVLNIKLRLVDSIPSYEIHIMRQVPSGYRTYKIYILEEQDGGRDKTTEAAVAGKDHANSRGNKTSQAHGG